MHFLATEVAFATRGNFSAPSDFQAEHREALLDALGPLQRMDLAPGLTGDGPSGDTKFETDGVFVWQIVKVILGFIYQRWD